MAKWRGEPLHHELHCKRLWFCFASIFYWRTWWKGIEHWRRHQQSRHNYGHQHSWSAKIHFTTCNLFIEKEVFASEQHAWLGRVGPSCRPCPWGSKREGPPHWRSQRTIDSIFWGNPLHFAPGRTPRETFSALVNTWLILDVMASLKHVSYWSLQDSLHLNDWSCLPNKRLSPGAWR